MLAAGVFPMQASHENQTSHSFPPVPDPKGNCEGQVVPAAVPGLCASSWGALATGVALCGDGSLLYHLPE